MNIIQVFTFMVLGLTVLVLLFVSIGVCYLIISSILGDMSNVKDGELEKQLPTSDIETYEPKYKIKK